VESRRIPPLAVKVAESTERTVHGILLPAKGDLPMTATTTRYSNVAVALHWLIGLAIIGNLAGGLLHESAPKDMQGAIMAVHKATGITILALSFVRLFWRLAHRPPPYEPTLKPWEVATAKITHWAFYLFMIVIPLTGWLMTSAGSRKWPLNWFGLFDLPYLPVAQDKGFANTMAYAHVYGSYLLIALLVLHIGAAFKHLFVDGDGTFARMVPGAG
jgi:cytochrome b561